MYIYMYVYIYIYIYVYIYLDSDINYMKKEAKTCTKRPRL